MKKEKLKDIKPLKEKAAVKPVKVSIKSVVKPYVKSVVKAAVKAIVKKRKAPLLTLKEKTPEKIPEQKIAAVKPVILKSKKAGHPSLIYKKYDNKVQDFYGDTRIVLLTRDSYWLFAYWEVSLPRIEEAQKELGQEFYSARSILRVYEVTNIDFNGNNAHGYFDITLENLVISYYLKVYAPEKSWVVDIGVLAPSGRFFTLARSNAMSTPADSMSNFDYEEWMDSSEAWKMYIAKASRGKGESEALYGGEFRPNDATSGSGGVSSLSSSVKYEKKPSAFWMRVGTELIVYGATEPDAKVTINNTAVVLNQDGSFSARFALIDGIHALDIVGNSADGKYKKSFKITVTQDTKKVE
ncbi:MAG: hypothetical protein A2452_13255 [Candidatus Firestonebacteria bacterium RIFOXYC2_FULL_39_67]|nr:MAG: hypothetical protein A2536_01115 [Candidatus Firestonebacteria bacterium RIFOXYD2_FULL_39_29]OGF56287.1 MAG: hypothetical protein A2452_13255 [Candidatus Firestonebacteria bacterium RIFOXYC2_FULL_39_67]